MNALYRMNGVVWAALIIICLTGCSAPPKTPAITYPAVSEIPPIPLYPANSRAWSTGTVCWVGTDPDAKWNNVGGKYAQDQFQTTINPLIRDALAENGYRVERFENQYITREKRLALQRIILCSGFEIKKTRVQEGMCYDMKLTLTVLQNPNQANRTQIDVWGRSVIKNGEHREWTELYNACILNLLNAPEFRQSLEPGPSV